MKESNCRFLLARQAFLDAALDDARLGCRELAVLLVLARGMNRKYRGTWPSIRTLAQTLRCGKSSVMASIRKLRAYSYLDVHEYQSGAWNAARKFANVYVPLDDGLESYWDDAGVPEDRLVPAALEQAAVAPQAGQEARP